jgi:hypothetical protein
MNLVRVKRRVTWGARQVPSQLAAPIETMLSEVSSVSPESRIDAVRTGSLHCAAVSTREETKGGNRQDGGAQGAVDAATAGWRVISSPRPAPSPLSRLELLHQHHADKSAQQHESHAEEDGDPGRPRPDESREQLLRKLERYESAQSIVQQLDFSMEPGHVADETWVSMAEDRARHCDEASRIEECGVGRRRGQRKQSPPPWVKRVRSERQACL